MLARRCFLLPLLLMASLAAAAAQSDRFILGYVQEASFWIDGPARWASDPQAAKQRKAIFVFTPPGTTFNTAAAVIIASSYANSSVADAQARVRTATLARDRAAQISELEPLQIEGATVTLMEVRSKASRSQPFETIAFIPLRAHVVVFTLSGLAEEPYGAAREAFMNMLATYEDAGMGVGQLP